MLPLEPAELVIVAAPCAPGPLPDCADEPETGTVVVPELVRPVVLGASGAVAPVAEPVLPVELVVAVVVVLVPVEPSEPASTPETPPDDAGGDGAGIVASDPLAAVVLDDGVEL